MSTNADTLAGPAPVEVLEVPEVSVQDRLDQATSDELKTWREKGDIPAIKVKNETPKPAASAPAKEELKATQDAPPTSKGETAAATPAALPQKQETRNEKRWRELSEKVGNLQRENEELKRKVSQPSAEVRETPKSQPAVEEKAPEKRAKPKLEDNDPKTGKPFASIGAWSDAVDDWRDEREAERVKDALSKAEQARTQTEQQRAAASIVFEKMKSAVAKYPDFKEVAGDGKLPIPVGSPVDMFLMDSDATGEVLYYLGKHPEVLAEFYGCTYDPDTKTWDYGDFDLKTGKFTNHVNPIRQVKRLEAIEREVTAAPPPKKEVASAPANPAPPRLPKPPTEVSGRGAASVDDAESALARGDTATYMRLMNARDEKAARR
jgi:hypothetical protein